MFVKHLLLFQEDFLTQDDVDGSEAPALDRERLILFQLLYDGVLLLLNVALEEIQDLFACCQAL